MTMGGKPANDCFFMRRAIALASRGLGHVRPNPAVGAVIVKGGRIIGEGWHRKAGGDHAEVAAMKNALRRGGCAGTSGTAKTSGTGSRILKGSTIFVTLEPCSKPGRVGACTDAIVAAGISRVVYAVPDPNPKNGGRAKRILAKAGVECERFDGDREILESASGLICGFRKHVLTGLPFVTVKIAMSLDGKTCDDCGDAKWISSADSRSFTGGALREIHDAIMVGAETVRKDDPSLLSHGRRNDDLVRVVVSKSGKLPKSAQVFADEAPNRTLVFDDAVKAVVELGKAGITSVLCEGGISLARSLAEAGLVDRWIAVLAPKVVGSRPIGKAVCGKLDPNGCFRLSGDVFAAVDFGF